MKKIVRYLLDIFLPFRSDLKSSFFERLNNLNISFVAQKKLGNAVIRNKVKRRLKNIMNNIIKINLKYSYLFIAKKSILDGNFFDIKETILKDLKKIK